MLPTIAITTPASFAPRPFFGKRFTLAGIDTSFCSGIFSRAVVIGGFCFGFGANATAATTVTVFASRAIRTGFTRAVSVTGCYEFAKRKFIFGCGCAKQQQTADE